MSKILEMLENIKIKAEELYEKGSIKAVTKDLFLKKYDSLFWEINYYSKHPELCELWKVESIVSQIEEFNWILSSIEKGKDEKKHRDFFAELISKIKDLYDLDLWVVRMRYNIPRCRFFANNGEFCFILQIPEKPDYLDINLLGILAHEPAHTHYIIGSMVDSIKGEKRKIGESLADVLAHSIVEYMFIHSSVYLVKNVIGMANASELKEFHPSWLARINVLRSLTDEIWTNQQVIQRNIKPLDELLHLLPSLSNTEQLLVQEILKEARRWMSEWIKYKTDENLLSELKYLSEDEVERIDEIPKKIRELIIGCMS